MNNLIIRKKLSFEHTPWDLLLMADPSRETIKKYLDRADIYLAFLDNKLVGVLALTKEPNNVVELKNIAVHKQYRRKGIGKKLILYAIQLAKNQQVNRIDVSTGNSSHAQLALYQKCGFNIVGIEKDFFVKNYKEPIFENGIQCVDMIKLAINLKFV